MRQFGTPTDVLVGSAAPPPDNGAPPPAPPSRRRWVVLAVVVAAAAAVAVAWFSLRGSSEPPVDKAGVNSIVDGKVKKAVDDLKSEPAPGVAVSASIRPALVVVQSESGGGGDKESALGSGVVVNRDGHILTALHVVKDATKITVTFADGTESPAKVDTSDADRDVAVLIASEPPNVIVPAVLGGGPRVGDEVFAVGHPLGLVDSLTAGVVSGLDRSFSLPNGRTLKDLIQFDAAVSPGNSGGPLLNKQGQVIGIVTGLANPSGNEDFVGIGFAVPIDSASRAAGAPAQ